MSTRALIGTWRLHTVTHHIDGGYGCYSTGKTLARSYEIDDEVLFLRVNLTEHAPAPLGTTGIAVRERVA